MRQSSVYSHRVEVLDHVVVWLVVCFAVSPGTWPGGAWVPGGPRPGFSLLLLFLDPNFAVRNLHQDVSRFTVHKGLRPNSRIMYSFFTSHQPMMNEQDQVTWTNWPASKKKKGSVVGLALVSFVSCCFLVIQDLDLKFRLTVSPAKRASPKFMKMVSFCLSHSL